MRRYFYAPILLCADTFMRRYFYAPILVCITISASAHSGSNTAFDERSCLLSAERSYSEALMLGDTTKTITGVVMEEGGTPVPFAFVSLYS